MGVSRRNALALLSSLSMSGLAGCVSGLNSASDDSSNKGDSEYDQLQQQVLYVGEDIELQLPDAVQSVSSPDDADFIVLSAATETTAEQVVHWLKDRHGVAVFGTSEEVSGTWDVWAESDAYEEIAGSMRDGGPPSSDVAMLQSRWYGGSIVSKYVSTWDHNPDNDEIIEKIDRTLREMENG